MTNRLFVFRPKKAEAPTTQRPEATTVSIYALDPFYGSRLSRIDVIFHQLNMVEEGCREQVRERRGR